MRLTSRKKIVTCLAILTGGLLVLIAAYGVVRLSNMISPTMTPSSQFWTTFPEPPATPYTTDAIYQSFEHGFMVWRSDQNCVYAEAYTVNAPLDFNSIIPLAKLSSNYEFGYCLGLDPLTDKPLSITAPATLIEPSGVLGKVWHYYPEIQAQLGYATAPEQHYTATIPTAQGEFLYEGSPVTRNQVTLPDGSTLACGSLGMSAGTCSKHD